MADHYQSSVRQRLPDQELEAAEERLDLARDAFRSASGADVRPPGALAITASSSARRRTIR